MDREKLRHLATLAELTLSAEEESRLVGEIGRILTYVAELEALDTTDVAPTAQVLSGESAWRADEPREGLTHEQALAAAPRVAEDGFVVPTFVES